MEILYIDRQIFIDYLEKRDIALVDKIISLKGKAFFPYSPAHMEEVMAAAIRIGYDYEREIECWSLLSRDYELLEDGIISLYKEHPMSCFDRCLDICGWEKTKYANELQAKEMELRAESIKNNTDITNIRLHVSQCTCENVFLNENVISCIDTLGIHNDLITLYVMLELCGFKREDNPKNSFNRMHDITHMLYGTAADYFISNDDKLINKAKAIYKYTGIKTCCLNKKEFLDFDFKYTS